MITFDGNSGAGKSTQCHKIAGLLGVPVFSNQPLKEMSDSYFEAIYEGYQGPIGPILLKAGMIRSMQSTSDDIYKNFILDDHCFGCLHSVYESDNFDAVIDLFVKALTIDDGKEPLASFYLDVPEDISSIRAANRRRRYHKLSLLEVPKSTRSDRGTEDIEYLRFWEYLSSKLPYLHIIDGTQDEDTVTDEMMSILRERRLL